MLRLGKVTPAAAATTARTSWPWCCSIPVRGSKSNLRLGSLPLLQGRMIVIIEVSQRRKKTRIYQPKRGLKDCTESHDLPIAQCCVVVIVVKSF